MELIYRGVRYQYNPAPVNVIDAPVAGKYRGSTFKLHEVAKVAVVQPILHLMYRGVHFDEGTSIPVV